MLGNFSFGDYFKQGGDRVRVGALAARASASTPSDIWVTVFEGDEELGLGPDEEAIARWESVGVPRERIVQCPRSENFWQAGPTGPCGPCSELYLDRGARVRRARTTCPAARTSASWSTGTSCSCSTTRSRPATLTPLPAKNIDTGLGPEPHGGDPAGQAVGLRDRPVPAADRARASELVGRATARTSTPTARCASSPTTRAR